jgi:thiamine biosynthesis lipoprotein
MIRTVQAMGTLVTIQVIARDDDRAAGAPDAGGAVERAFGWFREVEACCTRFDPGSEAMRLAGRIGVPVPASDILFEAVQFAVAVAGTTGGAFDPTVGARMEARGFNREHRTGRIVGTTPAPSAGASYRDIRLDPRGRTITLLRPLILDLGAVAKGLAIDLAARELRPFVNFAIDAGGDLYLGGHAPGQAPWSVGIRHPREEGLIDALVVSDRAVCTSGDYERRCPDDSAGHHLLDPRTGASSTTMASVTVVAPTAMVADALATAAFVLGPVEGRRLLEREGVEGLLVTSALERHATQGIGGAFSGVAVLPHAQGPAHHRAGAAGRARGAGRGRPSRRARAG